MPWFVTAAPGAAPPGHGMIWVQLFATRELAEAVIGEWGLQAPWVVVEAPDLSTAMQLQSVPAAWA
jgi:hypothetical protein